MNWEGGGKKRS